MEGFIINGIVAIVGRPNVGKSTLFNRIIGKRQAIVLDTPGVTRDRNYGIAEWGGKTFRIIDTGGLDYSGDKMATKINDQVDVALHQADVTIFLVDGNSGVNSQDLEIAKSLRKVAKNVILAVNKSDNDLQRMNAFEFYNLGLGDPLAISAVHGTGVGDLLSKVVEKLPLSEEEKSDDDRIKISIIGEPNVGKSSLVNRLLKNDRMIVSSMAGTTRDSISLDLTTEEGDKFTLIDTAGVRKAGKIQESIEKFSVIRSKIAVEESDVSLVLIDAEVGIREQDKKVAGIAYESGRGVIIVVNKWDTIEKDNQTMREFTDYVRDNFPYLSFAPIVFVSAKTGLRVDGLLDLVREIYQNEIRRIPSSILNDVLIDAVSMTPPVAHKGKMLKLFYLTQVSVKPPLFIIFVNNIDLFHFSYERYLINYLRKVFDFSGVPIQLKARLRK